MRTQKIHIILSFPRRRESTVSSFWIPVFTGMILFLLAGLTGSVRAGTYSGGDGSPENPYLIATAEDMNDIGANPDDWDAHFLLVADINLADYTGTQFNIIGGFTGVFDGNDHTISNFTYITANTDYIGLFGYVDDPNAEIKDLTLINPDVNVAGNSHYVGSLAGMLHSGTIKGCIVEGGNVGGNVSSGNQLTGGLVGMNDSGTILNCHAAGNVSGTFQTGGLVGYNYYGTISNCYATGTVLGNGDVGGLVGDNYEGTISNCYATANVSGSFHTGGLVGHCWWDGSTISNCYAKGSVSGDSYAGGLVGYNYYGTISNCYAVGAVDGNESIGGLMGYNGYYGTILNCYSTGRISGNSNTGGLVGDNSSGEIENCYATGDVDGNEYTGGLVGCNSHRGSITNCYSTGSVTGNSGVGGLVGYSSGVVVVVNSFWDVETSGQSQSAGGTGKTTAEMKTASTYLGWNGCGEIIWTIDEGNDYPRLLWEGKPGQPLPQHQLSDFLEGCGTQDDPYRVSTAEQLNLIGLFICEWDKHFVLVNDVDLSGFTGTQFNIIGGFAGVFDGNSHTISNFTYTTIDTDYIGVFGCVDSPNAEIKDLILIDPNVKAGTGDSVGSLVGCLGNGMISGCGVEGGSVSGDDRIGGLVGSNGREYYNYGGTISDCYATGNVNGSRYIGGLVGYNYQGTITNCYSTGSVSGRGYLEGGSGGLVGLNDGTITNCYSTGSVIGEWWVGGLVGENGGSISNCYATGMVEVSGSSFSCYVGGLVGGNGGSISNSYSIGNVSSSLVMYVGGLVGVNSGSIINCYSMGNVNGVSIVGGLVGVNGGSISNCYSTGAVRGTSAVGGLVGVDHGSVITSYFLLGAGPDNGYGEPLTDEQMKQQENFIGWDFVGETVNGPNDVWTIKETVDYPKLVWSLVNLIGGNKVDFADFAMMANWWGYTGCSDANDCDGADFDFSDTVDMDDLKIFCDHWLQGG